MSAEQEIRAAITAWSKALEAKDPDALAALVSDEIELFDVKPPIRLKGRDAYRKVWADCLPYFPDRFRSEHRDLAIHADGDCAFVSGFHHIVPISTETRPGDSWMRITVCYRKIGGHWKSVHEHVSIPTDFMTNQPVMITDPAQHDA